MTAIAFDTLKLARALRDDAHFPADQAEQMAHVFSEAFRDELATKADIGNVRHDLAEVKAELKADIGDVRHEMAEVKAELKADIAEFKAQVKSDLKDVDRRIDVLESDLKGAIERSKNETLRWVVPLILAQIAVTVGILVKLL